MHPRIYADIQVKPPFYLATMKAGNPLLQLETLAPQLLSYWIHELAWRLPPREPPRLLRELHHGRQIAVTLGVFFMRRNQRLYIH